MDTITIERVGNTDRAFRIIHGSSIASVRTRSSRRYLVVDYHNGYVEKRTNNLVTARAQARKALRFIVIDAVRGEVVR